MTSDVLFYGAVYQRSMKTSTIRYGARVSGCGWVRANVTTWLRSLTTTSTLYGIWSVVTGTYGDRCVLLERVYFGGALLYDRTTDHGADASA